jgi:hypothetical protein
MYGYPESCVDDSKEWSPHARDRVDAGTNQSITTGKLEVVMRGLTVCNLNFVIIAAFINSFI